MEATHGIAKPSAMHEAVPLDLGQRMLFNPAFNSNYLNFMVPAFALVPLQLAALLAPIRAGSSEYAGRFSQSVLIENPWVIVGGKVLSYLVILIPVLAVVLTIPHWFFGVPFLANRLSFWIVLTWIAASMTTLGYGLSAITRDALKATETCAVLTLPNFLLSGATWPVLAMSKVIWPLAYGFPMNSFAFMIKKTTVMGGTLADCGSQICVLAAWSVVAVLCAWHGTRLILKGAKQGAVSNA
jgi:ABC-2 type transport system permease protein